MMRPFMYRRNRRLLGVLALAAGAAVLLSLVQPPAREKAARAMQSALSSRRLFETVLYLETGLVSRPPAGQALAAASSEESVTGVSGQETEAGALQGGDLPVTSDSEPALWPDQTQSASSAVTEVSETAVQEPQTEATEAPADPLPEPFAREEADAISLRGNCTYKIDKGDLLTRPLDWTITDGPKILIIHSHSCESYTQCEGHTYIPDANFRTLQQEESVIAVGDVLAEELERLGVEVLHDRSWNDYPSYNRSYAVAREKIEAWLKQYPSIVMVLDLHRDALENPVRETASQDGVICAPLMLVVGTDEGGLNHPHWQQNLSTGLKLQALGNRETPGLFKSLSFRKERFNMDLTAGSLIVEVGSTENTLPEAQASMPYLARYVSELLRLAEAEAG